ncbi:MAG: FG-GAP repeat protein [Phycisphaerales bacterium]|nr:FG-GAP repeat protein [Phycisphaerales bacterium]
MDLIKFGTRWMRHLRLGHHDAGAVHVYERVGGVWAHTQMLQDCRHLGGELGSSVSIDGDWIVAGAPEFDNETTNDGAVLGWNRQSSGDWPQIAHLQLSDPLSNHQLGNSVALSGDVLIAGGPWGFESGAFQSGEVLLWEGDLTQDADADGHPDWHELATGAAHDWNGDCITG